MDKDGLSDPELEGEKETTANDEVEQNHDEDGELQNTLKKSKKAVKRGVVYLSHPPAFMKPMKVKHLLGKFGEVTNLYLAPEDPAIRKHRKKRGGSSKMRYKEGWIEFSDRKVAKAVAQSLNGTPIGGNRRGFHYEDLWSLKYLSGFQWSNLNERNAYEERVKKAKLRAEIAHSRRESEFYLEKVAQQKKIEGTIKKRRSQNKEVDDSNVKRTFKQIQPRKQYHEARQQKKFRKSNEGGGDDWLNDVLT